MSPGTFRAAMACICLRKETYQFIVRIDMRHILGSRRIGMFRQDICRMSGTVQVLCELPYDRGSRTLVRRFFMQLLCTPASDGLFWKSSDCRIVAGDVIV